MCLYKRYLTITLYENNLKYIFTMKTKIPSMTLIKHGDLELSELWRKMGFHMRMGFILQMQKLSFLLQLFIVLIIHRPPICKQYYSDHSIKFLFFFCVKCFQSFFAITLNILTGAWVYYPDIQFALWNLTRRVKQNGKSPHKHEIIEDTKVNNYDWYNSAHHSH